ncbi:ParB/RepB/Spo0J family partition protein [Deltaproteobacteria bacterium TL4]
MEKSIEELSPHPLNYAIYDGTLNQELLESIRKKGILNPIIVTREGLIISGHSRYIAAKELGMTKVPVSVCAISDDLDIREFVIESNRQREKTNEEKAREFKELKRIEEEKARINQQAIRDAQPPESEPNHNREDLSLEVEEELKEIAASKLKMRRKTAERSEKVIDAIDQLEAEGKEAEAKELRHTLNKRSIQKALEEAELKGLVQFDEEEREEKMKRHKYFKVPIDDAKATSELIIGNFSKGALSELVELLNEAVMV